MMTVGQVLWSAVRESRQCRAALGVTRALACARRVGGHIDHLRAGIPGGTAANCGHFGHPHRCLCGGQASGLRP